MQLLCAGGKIEGAMRFGRDWMIPKDAKNQWTEERLLDEPLRARICRSRAKHRFFI